jgi:taurine--2-oxoglutarate transaminase
MNTVQTCLDHTLFSWAPQGNLNPIEAKSAKGCWITAADGQRILDFSSQLMNVNIGHGHPKVTEAVRQQMEAFSYVYPGMATEVRARVGKKLADISPAGLNKTFFTLGGAEAIENAIKLARVYTGRHKIVTLYRSYHGGTYGAISAGGDPRKHPVDSQAMPGIVHVENPYAYRCPWGTDSSEACGKAALEHLKRVVQYENPSSVAAILLEGESGSSGCIKYPEGYWKGVAEFARQHGILLIDDEVMSGFGRTGKMFAIENHGVEPDMITMAKGLTCGYVPLGGLLVRDEIAEAFNERALPIGLTYSAHPVSLASADAVLDVYEEEGLIEQAAIRGKYVEARVAELAERHPSIGDFRNTGLLGCIELVRNRESKEPVTPWNAAADQMEATRRMAAKVRELGMFTFVRWNYIFIAPPLIISEEEIDQGMEILDKVIAIADEYYD